MARSHTHTTTQYSDHQKSRQKLLPHCALWAERARPRQTQGCERALRVRLVQYLFVFEGIVFSHPESLSNTKLRHLPDSSKA